MIRCIDGKSVIDYAIANTAGLSLVSEFTVGAWEPTCSDHAPLVLQLAVSSVVNAISKSGFIPRIKRAPKALPSDTLLDHALVRVLASTMSDDDRRIKLYGLVYTNSTSTQVWTDG